jgi:hypothetical protein
MEVWTVLLGIFLLAVLFISVAAILEGRDLERRLSKAEALVKALQDEKVESLKAQKEVEQRLEQRLLEEVARIRNMEQAEQMRSQAAVLAHLKSLI